MSERFIVLHNCVDPKDPKGRSYKEVNMERQHSWPVGSLVEINADEEHDQNGGVRLFVAECGRDCDGEPLYWLAMTIEELGKTSEWYKQNRVFRKLEGGYSEESLTLISLPDEKRQLAIKHWTDYYHNL
jgi:hypothetical protein